MGEALNPTALAISQQVRKTVDHKLRSCGFAPRGESDVYVRHRVDKIEDIITLPIDVIDNHSPIFVTANVGIHCPSLSPLVDQLSRGRYIPSAARLTRNIGDLMPSRHRWHGWEFSLDRDPQPLALSLADSIADVGIAWIEQFDRLEAVYEGFVCFGPKEGSHLRLAALQMLIATVGNHASEVTTIATEARA